MQKSSKNDYYQYDRVKEIKIKREDKLKVIYTKINLQVDTEEVLKDKIKNIRENSFSRIMMKGGGNVLYRAVLRSAGSDENMDNLVR